MLRAPQVAVGIVFVFDDIAADAALIIDGFHRQLVQLIIAIAPQAPGYRRAVAAPLHLIAAALDIPNTIIGIAQLVIFHAALARVLVMIILLAHQSCGAVLFALALIAVADLILQVCICIVVYRLTDQPVQAVVIYLAYFLILNICVTASFGD